MNKRAIYQQALVERVMQDCNHEAIDGEMFQLRPHPPLTHPPSPSYHLLHRVLAAVLSVSEWRDSVSYRVSRLVLRSVSAECAQQLTAGC